METDQTGPHLRLRAHQARRRGGDGGRQPPRTSSSAPRGCSGSAARNFVETMLRLAADHGEVLVVRDQVGSPTYTWHLAYGLVRLIDGSAYGIHHMAAAGECSWYDFAREIFDQAKVECKVLSATTDMLGRPAPRPAFSALVTAARRTPSCCPPGTTGCPATSPSAAEREAGAHMKLLVAGGGRLHRLQLRPPAPRASTRATRCGSSTSSPTRGAARTSRGLPTGRCELVEADICDRDAARGGDRGVRRDRQLRRRVARRPLDHSPGEFITTDVFGTYRAAGGRPRRRHPPPADLHRRGLRVDRGGVVHRDLAARPVLAVLGLEGRRRPDRLAPSHHTFGADSLIIRASNNYGPRQHPEKLIPLAVLNALHGDPVPVYGDGAPGPQLALRRGLLLGDRRRARARRGGRGLQRRRARRAAQHRRRAAGSSS